MIDGAPVAVQVRTIPNGFLLSYRGVEAKAFVYTEREAALRAADAGQAVADRGKKVLCPMPGLVVAIAVTAGQEVKAGETLAVVEAMKMENVLRAERDGTVKTIRANRATALRSTRRFWNSPEPKIRDYCRPTDMRFSSSSVKTPSTWASSSRIEKW